MTKEKLLRYLRDPEYLHQISYQELKTLVAEHPNSYTLRHLLAVKSRQEGNDDYLRQKEFASLYSIDRSHLFDVLTKAEILEALPEGVLLQEDYLELKELSALEKELSMTSIVTGSVAATTAITSRTLPNSSDNLLGKTPLPPIEDDIEEDFIKEEVGEQGEEYYTLDFEEEFTDNTSIDLEEETKPGKVKGSLAEIEAIFEDVDTIEEEPLSNEVSIESITNEEITNDSLSNADFIDIPLDIVNSEEGVNTEEDNTEEEAIYREASESQSSTEIIDVNPLPKSKFSTWNTPKSEFSGFDLVGYNSRGIIDELASKGVKKIPTAPRSIPQEIREAREKENENLEFESDIASETLAKILIIQGHYTKAIAMYKRLSLIFPEKSGLFAAEIKKIENLEDRSA